MDRDRHADGQRIDSRYDNQKQSESSYKRARNSHGQRQTDGQRIDSRYDNQKQSESARYRQRETQRDNQLQTARTTENGKNKENSTRIKTANSIRAETTERQKQ